MNREILFRGFHECKDGTQKAYYGGAWHHGDWIKGDLLMSIDGSGNVVFTCIMTQEMTAYSKHVNRETVGEYTGLPDKNGVMMFEWDIVQFKVVHNFETIEEAKNMDDFRIKEEVVQFVDGEFTPRNYFDLCDDGWYSWGETDFAVIGNIHDRKSSIQSREG